VGLSCAQPSELVPKWFVKRRFGLMGSMSTGAGSSNDISTFTGGLILAGAVVTIVATSKMVQCVVNRLRNQPAGGVHTPNWAICEAENSFLAVFCLGDKCSYITCDLHSYQQRTVRIYFSNFVISRIGCNFPKLAKLFEFTLEKHSCPKSSQFLLKKQQLF